MNEDALDSNPPDRGLRSVPGIQWLLLAGALLTGVSAYRLVESRWTSLPVELQFLVLALPVLGLYAAGRIARERLALRQAGAALLGLSVVLVPVLSWGAASMGLLERPLGLPALVLGLVPLLFCVRHALADVFHYRGAIYTLALSILAFATPVLPRVLDLLGVAQAPRALLSALALGAVLHAGARHVNRFLFHRDLRDGLDRRVSLVPFAFLGVFYVLASGALAGFTPFVAVPLAVVGLALVNTGEEFVLARANAGHREKEWPARSRALLAVGFALLGVALGATVLDAGGQAFAVVVALVAVRLLVWSRRHSNAAALSGGLVAAFLAYNASPVLFRSYAMELVRLFYSLTGVPEGSPSAVGFGDLGFTAFLVAFGALLARDLRRARDLVAERSRLVSILSVGLVAHALFVGGLGFLDLRATLLVYPPLALLLVAGVVLLRRAEPLAALQAVLVLLAGRLVFEGPFSEWTPLAGAAAVLAFVLAVGRIEPRVVRFLDEPDAFESESARTARQLALTQLVARLVSVPAVVLGGLLALFSLVVAVDSAAAAGAGLAACGAVFLLTAARLRSSALAVLATLAVSGGALGALLALERGFVTFGAGVTLALFVLGYVAQRMAQPALRSAGKAAGLLHGPFALIWLGANLLGAVSAAPGLLFDAVRGQMPLPSFGPSPLALVAVALWLLAQEFHTDRRVQRLALGLLVSFPAAQLFAVGLLPGAVSALFVTGLALGLALRALREGRTAVWLGRAEARLAASREVAKDGLESESAERSLAWLLGAWSLLAVIAGLYASGPMALALCLLNVVLVFNLGEDAGKAGHVPLRKPLGLLLLVLAQLPVALLGPGQLLAATFALLPGLYPVLAVLALAWLALHDAWDGRLSEELSTVATMLSSLLAALFAAMALHPEQVSSLAHGSLIACAVLAALRHGLVAYRQRQEVHAWLLQAFVGLALVESIACGFLQMGAGRSPWILLLSGVAFYAAARLVARTDRRLVFETSLLASAFVLPVVGSALGLVRALGGGADVWFRIAPAFLASGFFAVVASRGVRRVRSPERAEPQRVPASLLSAGLLGAALATLVHVIDAAGPELHVVAPGVVLIALSQLLRKEAGWALSRRLFTTGAAFLYLAPVLALRNDLAWGWQAVLLVLALAFGAASFQLRSRSLLTVSSAAFLVDLLCFVLKVQREEPVYLWAIGALLGLLLMAAAAALEWRREGVLQRLRVFASEVQGWSNPKGALS